MLYEVITKTIQSVLGQTHTNWELLLVDDVSIDNTVSILQSFAKQDARIKVFQLPKNSGPGVARNFAIQQAQGRITSYNVCYTKLLRIEVLYLPSGKFVIS